MIVKLQFVGLAILLAAPSLMPQVAIAQSTPVAASKEHEALKSRVGTWDAEITFFTAPDAEPIKSKGVDVVKMFGEFWVISDFRYQFMGQSAYGHGVFGYDSVLKKHVGNWFESSSPFGSHIEGTYDEKTQRTTYEMTGRDPSGINVTYKLVTSQPDKNHRTFAMSKPDPSEPGSFIKMMEIKYKRRVAALR